MLGNTGMNHSDWNLCLTAALWHCDSCEMELKVINVLFDSTSCCDRDSVAWQLPAAFRWLFWLRGKSEVALPSLVYLRVPAQIGFLAQIDVLISRCLSMHEHRDFPFLFHNSSAYIKIFKNVTRLLYLAAKLTIKTGINPWLHQLLIIKWWLLCLVTRALRWPGLSQHFGIQEAMSLPEMTQSYFTNSCDMKLQHTQCSESY